MASPTGRTSGESGVGLLRSIHVIHEVADSLPRGIGVSALARQLDLPKAVVHRILKTLSGDGFLSFDDDTKRYSLGPGALSIGLAALRYLDVPRVARPVLEALVEQTDETATLSIRQGWTRVYADQVLSPEEVRMSVVLGRSYPLHAGSSSKAILAALSDHEIDEYFRQNDLAQLTKSTLTEMDQLTEEVRAIRRRGYATSRGERQPDARSVAAAVFQANGQVFGSISLCGPISRIDARAERTYGALVTEAAAKVSEGIGYLGRRPSTD